MILIPFRITEQLLQKLGLLFGFLAVTNFFKHDPLQLLSDPNLTIEGSPLYSYATSIFSVTLILPPLQLNLYKNPNNLTTQLFIRDLYLAYFVKDFFLPMSTMVTIHHVICLYLVAGCKQIDLYILLSAVFVGEVGSCSTNIFYVLGLPNHILNFATMTLSNLAAIRYGLKLREKHMKIFCYTVMLTLLGFREKVIWDEYTSPPLKAT